MFVIKEEKKKVSIVKIIVIAATVAASVAAVITALMIWKKSKSEDKMIEDEIDAAFAEEEAEDAFARMDSVEEV